MTNRPNAAEDIADDELLSQYGSCVQLVNGEPFKCKPAYNQTDLSFMRGKATLDEAARSVNRKKVAGATAGDGVRYILAGRLRAAGFRVWHTPTKFNPHHVSVATLDERAEWTDDEVAAFKECFTDAVSKWKEGQL
jgi:hypothetical protein